MSLSPPRGNAALLKHPGFYQIQQTDETHDAGRCFFAKTTAIASAK